LPESLIHLQLLRAPLDPGHILYLPVVASSLLLALLLHRLRRPGVGIGEFLFPARLYRTRAFRLDLAFALLNQSFYVAGVATWILGADALGGALAAGLARLGLSGLGLAWGPPSLALFALATFVARDLGVFVAHALQHRLPVLWAFHEVHHTATHLTPLSALRAHPVDDLVTQLVVAGTTGIVAGVFRCAFGEAVGSGTVLGTSAIVLGFHLAGHHLRHSHVWLSYGPRLGRLLVSPAHHQIHHSRAPRHWNRNLGQFLAVWDALFGTLYVPGREPEPIEYGVSEREDARFDSLARLYLLPFVDAGRALRSALSRAGDAPRAATAATLARTIASSSSSTLSGTFSGGVT
jgi:sterol desaturase/sphingolipid hydroxylase (fatty acid hydroxylase superfamily)